MKRKVLKQKLYVCVVCGKRKRTSKKVKCCGKEMVSKNKGSWNL